MPSAHTFFPFIEIVCPNLNNYSRKDINLLAIGSESQISSFPR